MRIKGFELRRFAHRARLAWAAVSLGAGCLLLPAGLSAQSQEAPGMALPQLGDGAEMSTAAERRLGDRIARSLYRDPDYIDDPVLAEYVDGIWQKLLSAARQNGDLTPQLDEQFAWRVVLGRDRSVNAFALPGGYLGVHLGLIAVVNSQDELASVLGHELSHVTQRHIARSMAKSNQQAPWLMGAMILGALAASKSNNAGNAGSALIVGGQAVAAQGQLNFSRDMEREADRSGFGVMTQAGYAPEGFVTMFDKLQQASRLNDLGDYPYLRSHPLNTERIADMQSRLPLGAPHPLEPSPTPVVGIMSARARLLANAQTDALRTWQAQVDAADFAARPLAQRIGLLYGATLAASQLRDPVLARVDLARLRALVTQLPEAQVQVRWLGVEIELAAMPAAETASSVNLRAAVAATTRIERRPALLLRAELAVHSTQELATVAQDLQAWLVAHPQDALAWQWLARVHAAQHQNLRALRAEAEVQVAQLDYSAALDRLRAAQDLMRGQSGTSAQHIDASIIDMRRRQVEALYKQQLLER